MPKALRKEPEKVSDVMKGKPEKVEDVMKKEESKVVVRLPKEVFGDMPLQRTGKKDEWKGAKPNPREGDVLYEKSVKALSTEMGAQELKKLVEGGALKEERKLKEVPEVDDRHDGTKRRQEIEREQTVAERERESKRRERENEETLAERERERRRREREKERTRQDGTEI